MAIWIFFGMRWYFFSRKSGHGIKKYISLECRYIFFQKIWLWDNKYIKIYYHKFLIRIQWYLFFKILPWKWLNVCCVGWKCIQYYQKPTKHPPILKLRFSKISTQFHENNIRIFILLKIVPNFPFVSELEHRLFRPLLKERKNMT